MIIPKALRGPGPLPSQRRALLQLWQGVPIQTYFTFLQWNHEFKKGDVEAARFIPTSPTWISPQ